MYGMDLEETAELILCREVLANVTSKVTVPCNVNINKETLYINFMDYDNKVYTYMVFDIYGRIVNGLDSNTIAVRAVNDYKKHIIEKYFKKRG